MNRTHNLPITSRTHYQLCYEGKTWNSTDALPRKEVYLLLSYKTYNLISTLDKVIRILFHTWWIGNIWLQGRELHSHDSAYGADQPTISCTLLRYGSSSGNRTHVTWMKTTCPNHSTMEPYHGTCGEICTPNP